jgi:1-acyl-sn-glycerol-3-phosphate acyltransferase
MAGRDIGTVVLPDADLKLYLDASPEERARRRAAERGLAPDSEAAAAILAELRRRDAIDRGRAVAPLRAAPDATVLTTDGRRFEETVAAVVAAIRAVEAKRAAARRASGGEEMAAADRDPPSTADRDPARTADRDPARPSHLSPLIRLGAAGARLLARLLARVTIDGDPRSLPRGGPLILAANHLSNLDGVVIGGWLTPALGRRIHWLAKKEMLGWPIAGRLLAMSSFHAVDRGRGDVEAFRTAQRILEAGNVLFVFPEGTRSRTGALGRAQEGLAALALRTDAPIVPLAIWGTERVWPRGRLPRPGGHVVLRIGAPFRLSELGLRGLADRRAAKAAATEAIMARIARLLPEAYRGAYAGAVDGATEGVSTPPVR